MLLRRGFIDSAACVSISGGVRFPIVVLEKGSVLRQVLVGYFKLQTGVLRQAVDRESALHDRSA